MIDPPVLKDEESRKETLLAIRILDTPPEESFQDIARLASEMLAAPIAFVSFIDSDRQWFKARVNFETKETSRRLSFCAHAIAEREPLIVPDTQADPRFADNPLVVEKHFRFYAGVPLRVNEEGSAVGTLCVLDYVPRQITPTQIHALQSLARQVTRELQLRRALASSLPPPPPDSVAVQPGDVLGGAWTVVRPLGKGASGAVFEARGPNGVRAAIKVLLHRWVAEEPMIERFAREAQILTQLRSSHVCRLLDVGNLEPSHGALPFLVLELLEGRDLDRVLAVEKKVDIARASAWVADACNGVADAHDHGVVHRDLKPSNVFLAKQPDGSEIVKVVDFGIAKLLDANARHLTRLGMMLGTPLYMSPEQMVSPDEVGPRSDVWALGVVLYELVAGAVPFPGSTDMEVCAAVLSRAPLPLHAYVQNAPKRIEEILAGCLAKKPEARFASLRDLEAALRDVR